VFSYMESHISKRTHKINRAWCDTTRGLEFLVAGTLHSFESFGYLVQEHCSFFFGFPCLMLIELCF
jgi:hypothetical protein